MLAMAKIPNKSHYKLNEVCGLTGVKPYVLRFWESEFEEIRPIVSSQGEKIYRAQDLETVLLIKDLLFNKKMSIEEAKREVYRLENAQVVQQKEETVEVTYSFSVDQMEKLTVARTKLNELIEQTQNYLS